MKLWLRISFLLIVTTNLCAQIGNNPFEITSRLDSISTLSTKKLISPEVATSEVESSTSSIVPPVVNDDKITQEQASQNEELTTANPFEVSHIPIRKSKLKSEANALKSPSKKNRPSQSSSNAFLFWLNLLTAMILAIVINTRRDTVPKLFQSAFNQNVLQLNHREENKGIYGHYQLLYLSFFINFSIFTYLVLHHFYNVQGWKYYQYIFIIILSIYLIRHIFLRLIGQIFPVRKEAKLYGFTIQSFNNIIGIILIPLNLIIGFGPQSIAPYLLYFGLVVIAIVLILRLIFGLFIGSTYIQDNLFHFLLYICGFEIIPVLVLVKIAGNFGMNG